jgi:predicted Zn-dependent protease
VPWLEAIEGTLATRSRALIAWRLGDLPTARALLEELAGHKKPRPDVWYWLARVAADQGDKGKAIEAVDAFLEKVGKRAEYRKEAEELRASLA